MKHCQRFRDSLLEFFDDELDVLEKKEVEQHLKVCPHCMYFLNQLRRLRSHLRGLPTIKTSENFHILVRDRIRRDLARQRRAKQSSNIIVRRWVPAFGLTVLVAVVGFLVLDHKDSLVDSKTGRGGVSVSTRSDEDFNGPIQYVIDDIPSRISVSRRDGDIVSRVMDEDSVYQVERSEELRTRPTPVSF